MQQLLEADFMRQTAIFDPYKYNKSVAVVGVGAVGSALALGLAKLGIRDITLFDPDTIEPHNLPNQTLYGPGDIGFGKAATACQAIWRLSGVKPNFYPKLVDENWGKLRFSAVFLCVDTMRSRKEIWDHCLQINPVLEFVGDCRITATQARAYGFCPMDTVQGAGYVSTLYSDDEVSVEAGGCGTTLSIGSTARLAAGLMEWLFIKDQAKDLDMNEVILTTRPFQLLGRKFKRL